MSNHELPYTLYYEAMPGEPKPYNLTRPRFYVLTVYQALRDRQKAVRRHRTTIIRARANINSRRANVRATF